MLLTIATLLSAAATLHWFVELFSHFAPHYATAGVIFALAFALLRQWRHAGLMATIAAYHVAMIWPSGPVPSEYEVVDEITIVQFNVGLGHDDPGAVARWLVAQNADIVILIEAAPRWSETLEALRPRYPHQAARLADSPFGIALLSRLVPEQLDVVAETDGRFPHARLDVRTPKMRIQTRVLGVHPPPRSARRSRPNAMRASTRSPHTRRVMIISSISWRVIST